MKSGPREAKQTPIKADQRITLPLPLSADNFIDLRLQSQTTTNEKLAPSLTRRLSSDGAVPQHVALLFLFNAIIFGTAITQLLSSIPLLHGLQQTVMIFASGVIYSLFLEGLGWNDGLGVFGQSYDMWMAIDPHLLLFTMLPPLLAGDAMTMDTAIARKVSKHWLYLAGPGVVINAFLSALFLYYYLPYEWPFLLCLVTGSILCATDPVAVVALLKELGAPPILTVQIQGESLLNDGTAIVLFQLSQRMLEGEEFDVSSIIVFIMKTAACAWGLGLLIGWFFYTWITSVSNKLEGHASVIQVALSLFSAYWSFIIAEGVFHISGVLSTVAASLVLADKMWPVLVSKESMNTTWHMLEFLGNVIVFFLAGALIGNLMVRMPFMDYLHLIVIYLVLVIIRLSMLMASRPLMNYFGRNQNPPVETSVADCLVMTWGGLRGAVGLALAIQVTIDRPGNIEQLEAERVLFYVGGVAALTLAINATTCPALVKFLGVTSLPETKKKILLMIQEQLFWLLESKSVSIGEEAVDGLKHTLDHISSWIQDTSKPSVAVGSLFMDGAASILPGGEGTGSIAEKIFRAKSRGAMSMKTMLTARATYDTQAEEEDAGRRSMRATVTKIAKGLTSASTGVLSEYSEIEQVLTEVKKTFSEVRPDHLKLLGDLPDLPTEEQEKEVMQIVENGVCEDMSMVRAFNEIFLNLVSCQYWKLIEAGEVVPGTSEAEVLLSSIKLALSSGDTGLTDFRFVCMGINQEVQKLDKNFSQTPSEKTGRAPSLPQSRSATERLAEMVDSAGFNACVMLAIIANAIFIAVEDKVQPDSSEISWLIADVVFTCIFSLEFIVKFGALRCQYFKDSWNILDFVLVFLGAFSNVLSVMAQGKAKGADVGAEGRLVRLARVFRVMRLLRLFRLIQFLRILKAKLMRLEYSTEVAKHMQTITVLRCFIKAHVHSQKAILLYFGTDKKVDVAELARVIVESRVETYKAMSLAVNSVTKIEEAMLMDVNSQNNSKHLAEKLDVLVHQAHSDGVITSREAESVLHPVRAHEQVMQARIREIHFGYIRPSAHSMLTEADDAKANDARGEVEAYDSADQMVSVASTCTVSSVKTLSGTIVATRVKDACVQSSDDDLQEAVRVPSSYVVACSEDAFPESVIHHLGAYSSSSSDRFSGPLQDDANTASKRDEDCYVTPISPPDGMALQFPGVPADPACFK